MDRYQFIKSVKSIVFCIPIAGVLNFERFGKGDFQSSDESVGFFFPDKDNYLVSATCLFKTPGFGDGKNGNDSYVDTFVDIECYDNLYSAQGGFGDDTEIESNVIKEMAIGFSPTIASKIFYDGIKNINITILGHKPNMQPDRIPAINDKWNVRWEFLMTFKKGNVLSTGYSEPAVEYHFKLEQTLINNPAIKGIKKFFSRNQLLNHRTIDSAN